MGAMSICLPVRHCVCLSEKQNPQLIKMLLAQPHIFKCAQEMSVIFPFDMAPVAPPTETDTLSIFLSLTHTHHTLRLGQKHTSPNRKRLNCKVVFFMTCFPASATFENSFSVEYQSNSVAPSS